MGSNSFGSVFRMTTWGESHGEAIGAVIDGCPAGLPLTEEDINPWLAKRAPGISPYTSPRKESDQVQILSGTFEGVTTGAPISLMIKNKDVDSSKYDAIKNLARPGHANVTYLQKYGVFDWRGGGRASARETASRVAVGAVARKLIAQENIQIEATLKEVGGFTDWKKPLEEAMQAGDSLGGLVELVINGLPSGLGEPIYQKFQALLAFAMMGIPAVKGFEIGEGFLAAKMKGSHHNDGYQEGSLQPKTNHAGGTLGGITTGLPVICRVAFKPASSIKIPQETTDLNGRAALFSLPEGSRHDPCVAIRGVAVVEAMAAIVIADCLLMNRIQQATIKNLQN